MLLITRFKKKLVYLLYKFSKNALLIIQGPWILLLGIWLFFVSWNEKIILRELKINRIGHLIPDSFEQLHTKYGYRTLHFFGEGPKSNKYWCKRMKRELRSISGLGSLVRIINRFPNFKEIFFYNVIIKPSSEYESRYFAYLPLNLRDKKIEFSESENQTAKRILIKNGVDITRPILCLQVRNSLYLEKKFPLANWNYHDFRNSDIFSFRKVICFLIDNGFSVFRMGKFQESELEIASPHYHEFYKLLDVNDFIDVWLYANSSRVISTGSGPDGIATINDIPTFYINLLPLASFPFFANATVAPKKLRWKTSGKLLSLEEYWDSEWYFSELYDSNGVEIEDLNDEQILGCIKEWICLNPSDSFLGVRNGGVDQLGKLRANQQEFIHPNARISPYWLSIHSNQSYLLD